MHFSDTATRRLISILRFGSSKHVLSSCKVLSYAHIAKLVNWSYSYVRNMCFKILEDQENLKLNQISLTRKKARLIRESRTLHKRPTASEIEFLVNPRTIVEWAGLSL